MTSNEPIDGPGDGNSSPDYELIDDLSLSLRAERAGGGSGRVYEIVVACSDASGNSTSEVVSVTVSHDKGGMKK